MTTLTIEIPEKDTDLVVQILKKFKVKIKEEKPYDAEFVAKIKRGDEDVKNGNTVSINLEDLWK